MKFPKYKSMITLIPGGCLQFLDFSINLSELRRETRYFREEIADRPIATEDGYSHYLRCLIEDDPENQPGVFVDMFCARGTAAPTEGMARSFTEDYTVSLTESLECFKGYWLPMPFLCTTGQTWPDGAYRVEKGPSNWARGMFLPLEDKPDQWHLCIAFDTRVEDKPEGEDCYFALSQDNLNATSEFRLAWHVRDNSWFVNESWVDEWVKGYYEKWANKFARNNNDYEDYCLKHLAYYMTWLDAAKRTMGNIRVRVSDAHRSDAINVDLILDIGNSRTTGILVETSSTGSTNLNDSYLLELRDLSNPNNIYTDPFDTRVEFVDVAFGSDQLSRRSGRRTPAFAWPSCVRVGPEATRLSTYANCSEGNTGMSSPKRYLWDETRWQQSWRFNNSNNEGQELYEPMVTRGLFPRQLNEEGTPLLCFESNYARKYLTPSLRSQKPTPLFRSHFSRSSLMMFMVAEIVTQALVNINSPASRSRRSLSDKPRHLRRIIFTVPTAMPVAARRIFQRWVELAVKLIWRGLNWNDPSDQHSFQYQKEPEILCEWDEASCSQLVLLYNEIKVKHLGDANQYFNLFGKKRMQEDGTMRPTVRIASIDIGGGTTDLSITTHVLTSVPSETARILPKMEFRDGFNIAGDEIVREIVRTHIIPAIEKGLAKNCAEPRNVLLSLFGRYTQAKTEELRVRQGQFVRQIAVPIALGILQACETLEQDDYRVYSCRLGDFFKKEEDPDKVKKVKKVSKVSPLLEKKEEAVKEEEPQPQPQATDNGASNYQPGELNVRPQRRVLEYLEDVLRECGVRPGVNILDFPITFSMSTVSSAIRRTLSDTISSLCEMVHLYDSDILLVTGRPSAWRGVMQTVLAKTPISPDRIIAMRSYHVGGWYPCADLFGCIADPKSTVVVGAILCALSCGYLEGINFDSSRMRMTSTARYVGELNLQGQLENAKVWFIVDEDGNINPEENKITYHSPITVGYRQLAVERWPASYYYKLDYLNKADKGPFAVTVALTKDERNYNGAALDTDEAPQGEGEIKINDIAKIAPNGEETTVGRSNMSATLQTLPSVEGYWLDSGIVLNEG